MYRRRNGAYVAPPGPAVGGLEGSSLLEILVALGIVAIALTVFVSMLQLGVGSVASIQEQTMAALLARSQMETVKSAAWPGPYPSIAPPSGYTINVSSSPGPLADIQSITVRIQRDGRHILSVQGFKGHR